MSLLILLNVQNIELFVLFDVPGASRATHTTDTQEGQHTERQRERVGGEWTRRRGEEEEGGERFTCHCVLHVLLLLLILLLHLLILLLLHLLRPVLRRHKLSASCSCCLCSPSPRSSPRTTNKAVRVRVCALSGPRVRVVSRGGRTGGRGTQIGSGLRVCVRERLRERKGKIIHRQGGSDYRFREGRWRSCLRRRKRMGKTSARTGKPDHQKSTSEKCAEMIKCTAPPPPTSPAVALATPRTRSRVQERGDAVVLDVLRSAPAPSQLRSHGR